MFTPFPSWTLLSKFAQVVTLTCKWLHSIDKHEGGSRLSSSSSQPSPSTPLVPFPSLAPPLVHRSLFSRVSPLRPHSPHTPRFLKFIYIFLTSPLRARLRGRSLLSLFPSFPSIYNPSLFLSVQFLFFVLPALLERTYPRSNGLLRANSRPNKSRRVLPAYTMAHTSPTVELVWTVLSVTVCQSPDIVLPPPRQVALISDASLLAACLPPHTSVEL